MYIQKRKSLEDRINQVVHKMTSIPEEQFVAQIHFEEAEAELAMENIRSKREDILETEHGRELPRTEIRSDLISLYEELFILEKDQQEKHDEARFKELLLQEKLHVGSLVNAHYSYTDSLVGEKTVHTRRHGVPEESDMFLYKKYYQPTMLDHTEKQITLYNRVVEKSRRELNYIAERYPSEVLQRWLQELLHELEAGRRQLTMKIN